MENQNEKAFTIHIVDNETHEDKTIHTNAIIAGVEEKKGASTLVLTKGSVPDIAAACDMAIQAIKYTFEKAPKVQALVVLKKAHDMKEGEENEKEIQNHD